MKDQPPRRLMRDYDAVGYDYADYARRIDAEQGSRALLERQIRFHQYPCRLEALGE
jgi:hypothetical protein